MGDWHDLVREYFPALTDKQAADLLFEKTSFPMGSLERIKHQLRELKEKEPEL